MKKIFCCFLLSCLFLFVDCSKKTTPISYGYSVRPSVIMELVNDTITSPEFQSLVESRKIPQLTKMEKTILNNFEENKTAKFYNYYDQTTNQMITIKQITEHNEILYILQIKQMK